jgi:hypothetical protein
LAAAVARSAGERNAPDGGEPARYVVAGRTLRARRDACGRSAAADSIAAAASAPAARVERTIIG